ncbi:MAG TPA: phosphotransferase family protein [Acidimicrobiia bacterium]
MPAPDPELLLPALHRGGIDAAAIDGLHRVSGGASRETWLFDATTSEGVEHLVLRRDPGRATLATERSTEYALLAAAYQSGVAAPRVRMLLEDSDELGSGFVMDRVDGETIPRKILRDDDFAAARPHLARDCGALAATVHAVPVPTLPELELLDAPGHLAQWRALLDATGEPHAAFELGMRWMEAHLPPPVASPALVHGDFRNGNLMVGPEGIRALLDWELAHLGDPIEDLGWLCVRAWRFSERQKVAGGFGSIDELLDGYEAAGGARPTDDTLRFWVVLGTLRWGGIAMMQAFTHLQGRVRSVELAAIGRRVAETEWDLLRLLDGDW